MVWKNDIILISWFLCGISLAKSDNVRPGNATEADNTCFSDMECAIGDYCHKILGQEDDANTAGICESCGPLMTYNYEKKHCVYCPIYREKCYNNCCYRIDGYSGYEIRCVNDVCMRCRATDEDSRCTIQNFQEVTSKFIVAFAVAFSVALTSLIIYRFNFRRRRENFPDERRFSFHSVTSTSPVQQRTQELLQDRPPQYQTRHNYQHQQQQQQQKQQKLPKSCSQVTLVTSLAPPPYPGMESSADCGSDNVQPPPYSRTEGSSEKTLHI